MTDDPAPCPFCHPVADSVLLETSLVRGLWDGFPVSPGHALIVPRRHIARWSDATGAERQELTAAIAEVQRIVQGMHHPAGFNVGFNDGPAAGQTVGHLHIHVIPRYDGDVPDPRGGIRLVIPDKARYWEQE
ncbi:HIT family protein [Luteolibacter sp. GHJ8]|uniref:HIT family protein n=1 Tax=Luteolibacter rhizosphaerae TaxID=2989719 RepID=A0ABT3FZK8_9BACT|nr:HIT family protein [Luteolibacter rhizosphaerae]MCW1913020.1 HIT family protein [Luteolibacter rhizosphaerae]